MNLMEHKFFSKSTRQVALMVKLRKTDQNYSTTKSNTKLAFPSLICGFLEVISSCVNLVYCREWICSNSHLGKILQKKKKIRNIHILATMVLAYNMLLYPNTRKELHQLP